MLLQKRYLFFLSFIFISNVFCSEINKQFIKIMHKRFSHYTTLADFFSNELEKEHFWNIIKEVIALDISAFLCALSNESGEDFLLLERAQFRDRAIIGRELSHLIKKQNFNKNTLVRIQKIIREISTIRYQMRTIIVSHFPDVKDEINILYDFFEKINGDKEKLDNKIKKYRYKKSSVTKQVLPEDITQLHNIVTDYYEYIGNILPNDVQKKYWLVIKELLLIDKELYKLSQQFPEKNITTLSMRFIKEYCTTFTQFLTIIESYQGIVYQDYDIVINKGLQAKFAHTKIHTMLQSNRDLAENVISLVNEFIEKRIDNE